MEALTPTSLSECQAILLSGSTPSDCTVYPARKDSALQESIFDEGAPREYQQLGTSRW